MSKTINSGLMFATTVSVSLQLVLPSRAIPSGTLKEPNDCVARINCQTHLEHKRARACIDIAAPPKIVWQAIHEERNHDPEVEYSRVISIPSPFELVLEQKYQHVPIFGTVVCRLKNVELPSKRIDYSLESSNHLKAMEGSWVLTPIRSGSSTRLELSSFVDTGLPIPRVLCQRFTGGRLQKRLALVKKLAEAEQGTCFLEMAPNLTEPNLTERK